MKQVQLCFSSWLPWPSFGDYMASEVPGTPHHKTNLVCTWERGTPREFGVVEDNVAVGLLIGTSLTTAVCMGQKCVIDSNTGEQIKSGKKRGRGGNSTAHASLSKLSLDPEFSVWLYETTDF